ncbi:uncharacterized protein K02A2.6-like [Plutella xylostella]|uniref:uncharacterized protein K02A2.6-like n=1 Tax=Plutella xylostella TaxID=51655 RepID=UPI0020326B9D|nr:uncharacterized protein K02A2.6-like [Plutella xylostella]
MPIGHIEPYTIGSNNWDTYIRRVKQFITLNNIADTLQVATLVTVVGAECYELMCDLCSPDTPESKTFDALVTLVKDHLEPDRSEIAERHIFRQRTQRPGESIREYLQSLKHLAKTCNFVDKLEENLRDQFVSGLNNEDMRSRIFAEKNVDYKRAVELAQALEAAERHAGVACAAGAGAGAAWRARDPREAHEDDGLHRLGARAAGGGGSRGASRDAPRPQRPCARCGKSGHTDGKCRFKYYNCDGCGERGHIKSVCKSAKSDNSAIKSSKNQFFIDGSDTDDEGCNFYNLVVNSEGDGPYYATVTVENKACKFEIDTGSKLSVISKKYYDSNFSNIPIEKRQLSLKSYTGDIIDTLRFIVVNVCYGDKQVKLNLFVIENGGPPLMGRTWIKQLMLAIVECHSLTEDDSMAVSLRNEFPDVFAEGLGTFKSEFKLYLKDESPVFIKSRPMPLALRQPVERELDRLQREDVIYKVERSDYGTPIVPVIKSNGSIRICGDYKVTINPLLKDYHYPLPRIEDLFATLGGGEQYTKLDLSNAFQQCLLHEDSQAMTAITTHVGTFVYKRVPFGIKCIPENFQKIMEETLNGLPSTAVFADDICVTGKDRETHLTNLRAVLQRLKENGLRINFKNCKFLKDSVTYLGYKIDKFGLHTDAKKIEAIVAAPPPTNVTQLKSFMGLVNFYSKFCVNMSDILKPMYDLLKKNSKWKWTSDCDTAFNKIKKVLSSSPVLAHYDPSLELILSVDSSAYGLGAVLTQRARDGSERPLCCASRTLNAAELNYSQIDKEALAIVFGVSKHHQYLYGRNFTLRSDHRPLSYIFGKNKGLPVTAASRLQRYAVKLAAYNFNIEFVTSAKNCFADALSRLPLELTKQQPRGEDQHVSYLNFAQECFPISFKDIKTETSKDATLSKIYGFIMYGWPTNKDYDDIEKKYYSRRDSLHIDQGCIVWGYRIVVPGSLRNLILKEIHDGHPGIVRMKQIARNYVWWDNIDQDIEEVARECAACRQLRPAPPAAPLHSWAWPAEPWSRLHLDFLGPFSNQYYLILIDAHSKRIEAEKVNTTSAVVVCDCLRRHFARFGLPKRLVSDNGPPFSSAAFAEYLKSNGIEHTLVPPYHPSSNGAAENAVRTIKRVLKKAELENEDSNKALSRFLFMYRNTEQSTTGREPAVALLGRRLRGRLDLLRPDAAERVRGRQLQLEQRAAAPLRVVQGGQPVLLRDYSTTGDKWAEGVVAERLGPVSYSVKSNDGHMHKRHIDQILARKPRHSLSQVTIGQSDDVNLKVTSPNVTFGCDKDESFDSAEGGSDPASPRAAPPSPDSPATVDNTRPHREAAITCRDKLRKVKY